MYTVAHLRHVARHSVKKLPRFRPVDVRHGQVLDFRGHIHAKSRRKVHADNLVRRQHFDVTQHRIRRIYDDKKYECVFDLSDKIARPVICVQDVQSVRQELGRGDVCRHRKRA